MSFQLDSFQNDGFQMGSLVIPVGAVAEQITYLPIALTTNARAYFTDWGTPEMLESKIEYSFDGGNTYPLACAAIHQSGWIGRDGHLVVPSLRAPDYLVTGASHIKISLKTVSNSTINTGVIIEDG